MFGVVFFSIILLLNSFFFLYIFNRNFFSVKNYYYFYFLDNSSYFVFFFDFLFLSFFLNKNRFYLYIYKSDAFFNKKYFYFFKIKPVINLYRYLRFWLIGFLLFILFFYFLMFIRCLPVSKFLFECFIIIMFLYWLFSGFVFFVKKYRFSKFVSSLNRFWRRSYLIFWSIEGGVFLVFFYLTLNASEEPVYMYDQLKLYKNHFFSWRFFLLKLIPSFLMILVGYWLLLNKKWMLFFQQSFFLLAITLLLLYVFWLEFYQFFHIISFYGNLTWFFDIDEYFWYLDIEFRRTRLVNNYIAVCLMAKFWHLVFILVFWVFFLLRVNELNEFNFGFFGANLQNFIILYIMNWLYMYPWFKYIFRNHLDSSYYWFNLQNRSFFFRIFFTDIKLFFFSLTKFFFFFDFLYFFESQFFYFVRYNNFSFYGDFIGHSLFSKIEFSIK